MINKTEEDIDITCLQGKTLVLGLPLYGSQAFGSFTKSLVGLSILCTKLNIGLDTRYMMGESLVQRARNYLVADFLDTGHEYFMFIDADIEFEPKTVIHMMHMMENDKRFDVLAGVYPKKTIAWEKIAAACNMGVADENPEYLGNFTGDYVFNPLEGSTIKLNEPSKVKETGTGFMMIRRETFLKFQEKFPEYSYRPDHIRSENFDGSKEITAFFHCEIDPVSRRYLSEDYWFCHKVIEAGMSVWIAPWIPLKHHGLFVYSASLHALAAIGQSATTDVSKLKKKRKT